MMHIDHVTAIALQRIADLRREADTRHAGERRLVGRRAARRWRPPPARFAGFAAFGRAAPTADRSPGGRGLAERVGWSLGNGRRQP